MIECTLPVDERPRRAAEFDGLFAAAVRSVERPQPTLARMELEAEPRIAAQAADLITRETDCCSFFTFVLTATGGGLRLDVEVPAAHVGAIDGLVARATRAARLRHT